MGGISGSFLSVNNKYIVDTREILLKVLCAKIYANTRENKYD